MKTNRKRIEYKRKEKIKQDKKGENLVGLKLLGHNCNKQCKENKKCAIDKEYYISSIYELLFLLADPMVKNSVYFVNSSIILEASFDFENSLLFQIRIIMIVN